MILIFFWHDGEHNQETLMMNFTAELKKHDALVIQVLQRNRGYVKK